MPDGQLLEFSGVTKRFGAVTAVSGLSATVRPGEVTGFLGPNGAGKTTTLRILLGLVRATEGSATIGGVPYARLRDPLRSVGAVLEASSFHPGRSAAHHLLVYAQAARLPRSRVEDVLGVVGLADAAGRKVGGFSLGMRQRLGLAYALLGDPGVLVLDEPANGLDPEGIRWMRGLLRSLAGEGRTVLISSHLLAEVQQTVDALVILASGRLVYQGGIEQLADPDDYATVVDAPDRAALMAALDAAGHGYDVLRNGLTVRGAEPDEVGRIAAAAGIALSSLQRRGATLEDVFLDLVNGVRAHPSAGGAAPAPALAAEAEAEAEEDAGAGAAPERAPEPPAVSTALAIIPPAASAEPGGGSEPDEEAAAAREDARAAFAVAATGVIDIVPPTSQTADAASAAAPVDAEPEPLPFDTQPEFEPQSADTPAIVAPDEPLPFDPEGGPQPQPEQPGAPTWLLEAASPPAPEFAENARVADAEIVVDTPDDPVSEHPGSPAADPRDDDPAYQDGGEHR